MTKEHVLKALAANVRYDGRKCDEVRKITVTYDISKSAEGSCDVSFGESRVMCGVKLGLEKPYPDTPENGNLMFGAELTPLASSKFELGPPSMFAVELARVVDRGIRESHAIDTHALCITPKESVWGVMVDIVAINASGNLMDISALCALGALKQARFPKMENGTINYQEHTDTPLPITREPIMVTVFKIGDYFIVDPLETEEEFADARLTVTLTAENSIVALQKGGDEGLSLEDIRKMTDLAIKVAPQLREKL